MDSRIELRQSVGVPPPVGARSLVDLRAGVVIIALSVIGCGVDSAPAGSDRVSRIDSAGVEIVTSLEPAWGDSAHWRLAEEPSFDIGGADAPEEEILDGAFTVVSPAALPDGRVVVAVENQIRLFSSDGVYLSRFGRAGEGPGEFDSNPEVITRGDTIVAFDWRAGRVSRFQADGTLLGSTRATTPGVRGRYVGWTDAGPVFSHLIRGEIQPQTIGGRSRAVRSAYLVQVHRSLESEDTLLVFWDREERPPEAVETTPNPEGGLTVSVAVRGIPLRREGAVAVGGDELIVGFADAVDLRVISPEGDTVRRIRTPALDRPSTPVIDSVRAYWAEKRLDTFEEPGFDPFAWWEGEFIPDSWPPFEDLLRDPDGNLWLRPVHLLARGVDPVPPQMWPVFDSTGVLLGKVAVPGHIQVTTITRDAVLGVYFDEWNSLHLVRYPLVKGVEG